MSVTLKWNTPRTECTLDYAHMRRQTIVFLLYSAFSLDFPPTYLATPTPILRVGLAGAVIYLIFTVVGIPIDVMVYRLMVVIVWESRHRLLPELFLSSLGSELEEVP